MKPKVEFEEDGFVYVRAYENGKLVEYRTNSPHHKHPLLTDDLRHQALHYAERMQKQREIESGRAAARAREAEIREAKFQEDKRKLERAELFQSEMKRRYEELCQQFGDVPDKKGLAVRALGGYTRDQVDAEIRSSESWSSYSKYPQMGD